MLATFASSFGGCGTATVSCIPFRVVLFSALHAFSRDHAVPRGIISYSILIRKLYSLDYSTFLRIDLKILGVNRLVLCSERAVHIHKLMHVGQRARVEIENGWLSKGIMGKS